MKILFLIIMMIVAQPSLAQTNDLYKEGSITGNAGSLSYRYLLPENFDKTRQYPLVLFLHGAGERGDDNKKQLIHGSKMFQDSLQKYPAVVVFPQCPADDYWASVNSFTNEKGRRTFIFPNETKPTKAMLLLMDLVDSLAREDFVDKNRFYITGLSMGGMGTFELLSRRPNVFAAAAPICGGGNPEMVKKYNPNTALWVFHGAKDDVVPPVHSTAMVLALQQQGFNVRYTLYHNANHNSWDPAFRETEFLTWLFSQKLNKD